VRTQLPNAESLLAGAAAVVGGIGIASALTPEMAHRVELVRGVLPPGSIAAARVGALAFGIALIWLSRSLARRRRRAWQLAVGVVVASAAAHLAKGVAIEELGPPIDPEELVRLELPEPEFGRSRIRATVLAVDRFGNLALNLTREQLGRARVVPGTRVELSCRGERYYAVAARTFGDTEPGELILYEDSYRQVAVAVSRGNAAAVLGAGEGSELLIQVDVP